MRLEEVTRMIGAARVTNLFIKLDNSSDKQIWFELTWDDNKLTFKYILDFYKQEGIIIKAYFQHDYDCLGRVCPICNEEGSEDCYELSEDQLSLLKEKLIQTDLKLMFVLN